MDGHFACCLREGRSLCIYNDSKILKTLKLLQSTVNDIKIF